MNDDDKKRRNSLLCTLAIESLMTVRQLRQDVEGVHGIVMSADLVRADLSWLAEMGLVRFTGEAAQCTERGVDVAFRRTSFPGLS